MNEVLIGLIFTVAIIILCLMVIYWVHGIYKYSQIQAIESLKQTRLLSEIAEKQGVLKTVIDEIRR